MSTIIDIIQEGYSRLIGYHQVPIGKRDQRAISPLAPINHQRASGSCCLVRSSTLTILFDTMGPWEKDTLLSKLHDLKVHPDDINYVIGSHGHADHIGNMNLFTKCRRQFIGTCSYNEDIYYKDYFDEELVFSNSGDNDTAGMHVYSYEPSFCIDDDIVIKATPGHTNDDVSLILGNCDKLGRVALAGDLFERAEDVEDESIWISAGSTNKEVQRYNRKLIYNTVDWILPGHGPLFKTQSGKL